MKVNKLALIVTSIALYVMNVKRKSNLCEDNFKHVLLLILIDVVFVRFSHRRQKYAPPPRCNEHWRSVFSHKHRL